MTCEWCREIFGLVEARFGRYHTRCWNEAAEERTQRQDDAEAAESFPMSSRLVTGRNALAASEATNNDMATATQPRTPREVVDFPFNTPVTVALKYPQGKTVSSQYGERILLTLTDGRIMFLDPEVAGRIESLAINVRESFTLTRCPAGPKGGPPTWDIARIAGEQPNGTLVLPTLETPTPKPPAATPDGMIPRKPTASALVSEANGLVDAFAEVLERALTTYQGRVKPDEVRALLISAYIQRRQLSSAA